MGVAGVAVFSVTCCLILLQNVAATSNANQAQDDERPVRFEVEQLWGTSSRQQQLAFSDNSFVNAQKLRHGHEGSGEEEWQQHQQQQQHQTETTSDSDDAPMVSYSLLLLITSSAIAIQRLYSLE
uniref:Uncharacterized protein n=1 Tax=Plectus sambesii TaxID=2011161 RepID=A0A914W404_9BILA